MKIFFVSIVATATLLCQAWGQHLLVKTKDDNKTFLIKTRDDHDKPILKDLEDHATGNENDEEHPLPPFKRIGMYLLLPSSA